MYTTLIETDELSALVAMSDAIVVDCRFDLADVVAGLQAYLAGHIPGAVYARLDEDLSGPPFTDHGRHPLPSPDRMIDLFQRLGINRGQQVVVYDDANGAIAARLWWMLRYMGHEAVAVLNGGIAHWSAAGLPLRGGREENAPGDFSGAPREGWLVRMDDVAASRLLIDSRAPERYRGEIEPLDSKAGHIPGALNHPFEANWTEDGRFLSPDTLRRQWAVVMGERVPEDVIFYCGSGVTACNNLLALAHAGLGDGRLYAGSWSDWISDPTRPIATGPG